MRLHGFFFFFFNDTAPTEIYTLSLHDALPISRGGGHRRGGRPRCDPGQGRRPRRIDRKSTRLNSSHTVISYAVFCLKKKKKNNTIKYAHNIMLQQVRMTIDIQDESLKIITNQH